MASENPPVPPLKPQSQPPVKVDQIVHRGRVSFSPVELLATTYGPYAFGVISLLLIWFTIVKPELSNRALDFDNQRIIVQELNDVNKSHNTLGASLASTAQTMQVTAATLERAVEKLEKQKAQQ